MNNCHYGLPAKQRPVEARRWGTFQVSRGSRVLEESGVFKPSVEWVCACAVGGLEVHLEPDRDNFFIHSFTTF